VTEEQLKNLRQRLQESRNSLNIARLPDKTKEEFIALANAEFVGDYGWTLREILSYYFEHRAMKALFFQNIDMKLDQILDNISQNEKTEEKPKTREIKMCDGKRIEVKKGVQKK